MDINKIATMAAIAKMAAQSGLVIVGGVKAIAALFGHDLTPAEQDAILVAVRADALTRRDERQLMTGDGQ